MRSVWYARYVYWNTSECSAAESSGSGRCVCPLCAGPLHCCKNFFSGALAVGAAAAAAAAADEWRLPLLQDASRSTGGALSGGAGTSTPTDATA